MISNSLRQRRRAALRAGALGAAAAIAIPAFAQDATGDDETVAEVVVTAQFREQRLQDTPLAITAVTAEMLEQRSQTSLNEIAANAPGVVLKGQTGAYGPSLAANIRGVGQQTPNPAVEPGVGIYVDDVYYPTIAGSVLDLLDLERVEILRGPQGTLAGKNSIGGAIKLYSKRPTGDGSGYLQVTYGSRDRVEARAATDFTLVPDKLFARVAAASKHQDGYVERLDFACANPGTLVPSFSTGNGCRLGTEGGKQYTGIRTALRWIANDNIEVNIIGDFTDDNSQSGPLTLGFANNPAPRFAQNGVPYDSRFIPNDPYVSYATYYMSGTDAIGTQTAPLVGPDRNTVKGWGFSGQVDWQLAEDLKLTSITAWRGMEAHWAIDIDVSPYSIGLGTYNLDSKSFTQELRLNGSVGSAIDYTVGAFYLKQDAVNSARANLKFISPTYDLLTDDPIYGNTQGAFVHGVWHATDKANVTAGVRYTEEEKHYEYNRYNPDGTVSSVVGFLHGQKGDYEGDKVDYRLGLDYHWLADLMTYVNYATGFKGGGVNPAPLFIEQVRGFDPEELASLEVGVKTQLFDRRLTLNVAAFSMDYKDIQLTLLSCPQFSPPGQQSCAMPFNAGNADVKGIEVETVITPIDHLTIDASFSTLDFEYTSINDQAGGPTRPNGPQYGMRPTYTPEKKGNVGIQYEFRLGNAGTLTPRMDVSYTGNMYANAVNTVRTLLDSYTLFSARLTWRSPEDVWEVAAEGTNLDEELYYITRADLSGSGMIWQQPAPPRDWGITFKRKF
jgi:iron complex outermembrane receptor protein